MNSSPKVGWIRSLTRAIACVVLIAIGVVLLALKTDGPSPTAFGVSITSEVIGILFTVFAFAVILAMVFELAWVEGLALKGWRQHAAYFCWHAAVLAIVALSVVGAVMLLGGGVGVILLLFLFIVLEIKSYTRLRDWFISSVARALGDSQLRKG